MKRVKCYGRMKAVCIDERINKIFQNDDDISLWNLSFAEDTNSVHPKQNISKKKKLKKGDGKEKKNIAGSSPRLYDALNVNSDKGANSVENDENLPPKVKTKGRQGKPKVKKSAPKKKGPKAGGKRAKKDRIEEEIAQKENVPNFSLIGEYSLYVEKKTDSKKRENSQPYPICSKHVCLTTNEADSGQLDESPCASNLSSNVIMPQDALLELERTDLEVVYDSNASKVQYSLDKNTETSIDHNISNDDSCDELPLLRSVNTRQFINTKLRNNFNNNLLWKNLLCSPEKLPVSLDNPQKGKDENSSGFCNELSHENLKNSLSENIEFPDINLVKETSLNHMRSNEIPLSSNQLDKLESEQASSLEPCAQIHAEDLIIPDNSNVPGLVARQGSGAKEPVENNSDLEGECSSGSKLEKYEEHNIIPHDELNLLSLNSVVSLKTKGFIVNSTPIVKERKCVMPYPSPNLSMITQPHFSISSKSSIDSCAKKFRFVTSTPSGQTIKPFKERLPIFNLSHISMLEKEVNSCIAKSTSLALSSLYNRTVTNLNKSRSLTVLYDVSKLINKPSQLISNHQMQFASDSNKSRTCVEKVASKRLSLTSSDLHKSVSITEKLLELCGQESVAPIASVYDWSLIKIKKIGEGTYGEVFMLSQKKPSVIKIIPITQDDTNTWLNLESVYSEVKVSYCLSALRKNKYNKTSNFSKVNSVHFVKGCYPEKLITAWDTFSVNKSTYNIRPDCFNSDQLYVILDLEYGGKDMTCFEMKNAMEAESILKQITISLAIAEETHLFEHRDLHLGNILVQKVKKKTISYVLGGKPLSIPSQGVMVTIIDFTLSRVFDAGCVYFHNLADDESLFNQSGDLQFEIYRATREHLQNQWHDCALYSNVLWLAFLCVKMKDYKYSNPTSKRHLKSLNDIAEFQKGLKLCQSALDSLKLCKLPTTVPSNSSVESLQLKKTKFVDRKSLQKSKTNLRN